MYILSFEHRYELDQSLILWVEASKDGGATWSWLGRYGSYETWIVTDTGGHFVQEVLDLGAFAGQSRVLIRFRFDWTSDSNFYGRWYIDDVKVYRTGVSTFDVSPPSGTIRSVLTLSGCGFGATKGKVLVGSAACSLQWWSDSEVRCLLPKKLQPGLYSVSLKKPGRAQSWISMPDAFAVVTPSIESVQPDHGPARAPIAIVAPFLSTRSESSSVKLAGSIGGKTRTYACRITGWTVANATGATTIACILPAKIPDGVYDLKVSNRGLAAGLSAAFTVP